MISLALKTLLYIIRQVLDIILLYRKKYSNFSTALDTKGGTKNMVTILQQVTQASMGKTIINMTGKYLIANITTVRTSTDPESTLRYRLSMTRCGRMLDRQAIEIST